MPNAMVNATIAAIAPTWSQPICATFSNVIRAPRSATPMRRIVRPATSMPGFVRGSAARKLNAVPKKSA
jgi:hypothetical protein